MTNEKKLLYCIAITAFCFIILKNYHRAYSNINSIRQPYRETAGFLAKDERIYLPNSLVVCNCSSGWIEYYFNKRGFKVPANAATGESYKDFQLFIDKGQYIQPELLSQEDIIKYDYLFLFEEHGYFQEDIIETINNNFIITSEYKLSKAELTQPFGLRIYSKLK